MKKMNYQRMRTVIFGLSLPLVALLAGVLKVNTYATTSPGASTAPTLRALIVGGGPSSDYNQVSISKNVRYVRRLLPVGTPHITLFATGNPKDATVLEGSNRLSAGESMLHLLSQGSGATFGMPHYAKPDLGGRLDGASSPEHIKRAFAQLNGQNRAKTLPLLLYFTGHGGPGWGRGGENYDNNTYSLWDDEELTVRELAAYIGQLPPQVPVTLVMVQCYSGGFGNVLFKDGNPNGPLVGRDIAGFFATVKDHTAAGCTSEVNEKEYRDFTSYFFAALCGQDRVGRRITGADYNADGRVGMDEAYYYALAHDVSIDIPTATSDVFLRRFVPAEDRAVLHTSYSQLLAWASPAQKAALGQLSLRLKLTGEERLGQAYSQVSGSWLSKMYHRFSGGKAAKMEDLQPPKGPSAELIKAYYAFYELWKTERSQFLKRYPALVEPRSARYRKVRQQAVAQLEREVKAGRWKKLSNAYDEYYDAYAAQEKSEINQALYLRFIRLCKSVVLAHRLASGPNLALKQRFARLQTAEARSLLPFKGAPFTPSAPRVEPTPKAVAWMPQDVKDSCGCALNPSSHSTRVPETW